MIDTSDQPLFDELLDVLRRANLNEMEALDVCISVSAVLATALEMPYETALEMLASRMGTAAATIPRNNTQLEN
jgi:hypothetical protein